MDPTPSTTDGRPAGDRPASTIDHRPARLFLAAGGALLASVVVPRLGEAHSTAGHVAGVALVGLGAALAAAGLFGLVRLLDARSVLARVGAVAAAGAVLGASGLVVGAGLVAAGVDLAAATSVEVAVLFRAVALLAAAGLALGYVSVGLAHRRADGRRRAGAVLAAGGAGLGLPVATALLGVATPGWLVLPAIGAFALATLTAGAVLRPRRA